jgi:hypothetical protein
LQILKIWEGLKIKTDAIEFPDETYKYFVDVCSGGILVFCKKGAYIWRKGEGWVYYEDSVEVEYGEDWDMWDIITEEQALARIKEIEEYGYEYKSKVLNIN